MFRRKWKQWLILPHRYEYSFPMLLLMVMHLTDTFSLKPSHCISYKVNTSNKPSLNWKYCFLETACSDLKTWHYGAVNYLVSFSVSTLTTIYFCSAKNRLQEFQMVNEKEYQLSKHSSVQDLAVFLILLNHDMDFRVVLVLAPLFLKR